SGTFGYPVRSSGIVRLNRFMPNRAAGGYEDKDDVDEVDARRAAIVAKVFAHSMLQAVDSCFFEPEGGANQRTIMLKTSDSNRSARDSRTCDSCRCSRTQRCLSFNRGDVLDAAAAAPPQFCGMGMAPVSVRGVGGRGSERLRAEASRLRRPTRGRVVL